MANRKVDEAKNSVFWMVHAPPQSGTSAPISPASAEALIFFCLLFFYQEKKRGNPLARACPLSGPFVGRMQYAPTNGAAPLDPFFLFSP